MGMMFTLVLPIWEVSNTGILTLRAERDVPTAPFKHFEKPFSERFEEMLRKDLQGAAYGRMLW